MLNQLAARRLFLFKLFLITILSLSITNSISQSCNNWLSVPNQPSFVRVGDLDITGDKITVEATFNRTTAWTGADVFQGDLVSKHEDVTDCNYVLRPGSGEITTTRGYFKTPTICNISLNKTYHAALVYDGTSLKFYRNGFLMSQIAASGNLVQNNWQTQIGLYFNQLTRENFIGYINEVRIWNIARTQNEIRTYMNQSLPSPQSTPGLQAYYVFDNLLNKQGNTAWNGTLSGNASINRTNPNCNFIADSCNVIVSCQSILPPDFGFEQEVCNPKKVNFNTNLSNIQSYSWEFGDGQKIIGNANPSVIYTGFNSYTIKLKVQYNSGCFDSIIKTVPVLTQHANLVSNEDTTICYGDSVALRTAGAGLNFCWQPATSLINVVQPNPIVKPSITTTYTYTSKVTGSNLVVNGDFTNGNSGFLSSYTYSSSGIASGVYTVGSNPVAWHPNMTPCQDHTTGNGNMMMVNGAEQTNVKVWSQTVVVTPNTNYAFSTWLQTITTINPAQLQFSINGERLGSIFTADAQSCKWNQFYATWNSGTNTTATISIVNMNQIFAGNDFAIDDIVFSEVFIKQDTVKITVAPKPGIDLGDDLSTCRGAAIQLNAQVSGADKIAWSPSLYLDNATIVNPTATPLNNITYTAEAVSNYGCTKKDTLNLTVVDKPLLTIRPDTAVCQGIPIVLNTQISNTTTFSWQPSTGLSNPLAQSPTAIPTTTTKYTLTAVNGSCTAKDSTVITVKPLPDVTISNDTTVCERIPMQLAASGGTAYQWSPSISLSADDIANPVATPDTITTYKVVVTGVNGCIKQDSVTITVSPKPVFSILPKTQSICLGDTAALQAFGGDVYTWTSSNDNSSSSSASIAVAPKDTTLYKVIIKSLACNIQDSLFTTIDVKPFPVISLSKSNDVDCSHPETQLMASGGNKYEWFPAIGISDRASPNPVASPTETTTYRVAVTSADGCKAEDSITIAVTNNGKNGFYIPSAFTPNKDGKNDCFAIKNWGSVEGFMINIYNRWGEKVFTSNTVSFCWDGTYKGKEQPSAVFVYYVKAKTLCGDVFKKGIITLIR